MIVCELEPNGDAPWELVRKFGGRFGIFERLKMGGIGSPKLKYLSGSIEIDKFIEETAGSDIPYTNFEYLKKGILVRVNKTQYLKGILISFDEISKISLVTPQKMLEERNIFGELEKAFYELPYLKIEFLEEEALVFEVIVQSYNGIKKYFEKNKWLGEKFESKIIT